MIYKVVSLTKYIFQAITNLKISLYYPSKVE